MDRLFVPLNTEHYENFQQGKEIEVRGYGSQYNNHKTVLVGRRVELRKGYNTNQSIFGEIEEVWVFTDVWEMLTQLPIEKINPNIESKKELEKQIKELLSDYDAYIAFKVDPESMVTGVLKCHSCGKTFDGYYDVCPNCEGNNVATFEREIH